MSSVLPLASDVDAPAQPRPASLSLSFPEPGDDYRMDPEEMRRFVSFTMKAHTAYNTRDLHRRFDGKTPFFVHPVGMMATIFNDSAVDWNTRVVAGLAALLHAVLEDTSVTKTDLALFGLPVGDARPWVKALCLVEELTFETSAESQRAFMKAPESRHLAELLVRTADILDNLVTFPLDKQRGKLEYLRMLRLWLGEPFPGHPNGVKNCVLYTRLDQTISYLER